MFIEYSDCSEESCSSCKSSFLKQSDNSCVLEDAALRDSNWQAEEGALACLHGFTADV
jgi:hypothetical protein